MKKNEKNAFFMQKIAFLFLSTVSLAACQPSDEAATQVITRTTGVAGLTAAASDWSNCSARACDGAGVQSRKIVCMDSLNNSEVIAGDKLSQCRKLFPDLYNTGKTPLLKSCDSPAGNIIQDIKNISNQTVGIANITCQAGSNTTASSSTRTISCGGGYGPSGGTCVPNSTPKSARTKFWVASDWTECSTTSLADADPFFDNYPGFPATTQSSIDLSTGALSSANLMPFSNYTGGANKKLGLFQAQGSHKVGFCQAGLQYKIPKCYDSKSGVASTSISGCQSDDAADISSGATVLPIPGASVRSCVNYFGAKQSPSLVTGSVIVTSCQSFANLPADGSPLVGAETCDLSSGYTKVGNSCEKLVSSTSECQAGQYWDGQSCTSVDPAYSKLAAFSYGSVGFPSGFEATTASPTTYSDADFSTWTASNLYPSAGASTAVVRTADGNPGGYLEVRNQITTASDSQVAGFHQPSNGASWNPKLSGAITSIDFSIDSKMISGFGSGQAMRPAVRQDGVVFVAEVSLINSAVWTNFSLKNLTASGFKNILTNPLQYYDVGTNSPDFSSNGGVIEFGFVTANSGLGYSITNGYDNWSMTIATAAPSQSIFTAYVDKTYDIAPIISPTSGIIVNFGSDDCANSNILVGLNGHLSFNKANISAGQTLSCSVKAINPVGIATLVPIVVKIENPPFVLFPLSVADFTLHENVNLYDDRAFCPIVKTGTFVGEQYSLIDRSGNSVGLNLGGSQNIYLNIDSGCLYSGSPSGMNFYSSNPDVAPGTSKAFGPYRFKYGSTYSNEFEITVSRIDDASSLASFEIMNKFIRLDTDNRVNAITGGEVDPSFLPQLEVQSTLTLVADPVAAITPAVVLDSTDSNHVSTSVLFNGKNPGDQATTIGAATEPTVIKELRESIFNSLYTFKVTNSASSAYDMISLIAHMGTREYRVNNGNPIWPGQSFLKDGFSRDSNARLLKNTDETTGDLFAEVSITFNKLLNTATEITKKIFQTDSSRYDEVLLAKRMTRSFVDSEDEIGISGSNVAFGSDLFKRDAGYLDYYKNPVVRLGTKVFFVITKSVVGGESQKLLAYRDLDPAVADADRVKIVLTDISVPSNNNLGCGSYTCFPSKQSQNDSEMMIFKYGEKLIQFKYVDTNIGSTFPNQTRFSLRRLAVFTLDPNALNDATKNSVYISQSNNLYGDYAYFLSQDELVVTRGYGFINIFDLKTKVAKKIDIVAGNPGSNDSFYSKFIKVGTNKYVIGNSFEDRNGNMDNKAIFVDLSLQSAKYISLSRDAVGWHSCSLIGAGMDAATGLKASFVCKFGTGSYSKFMSYLEIDGPSSLPYFILNSNIKNGGSDVPREFVSTFDNGNAIAMAAGDAQASANSFFSVKHGTKTIGGVASPAVVIEKINFTGDIGKEWDGVPGTGQYIKKGNKIYFLMDEGYDYTKGYPTTTLYRYDDSTSSSKVLYQSFRQESSNNAPRVDEVGNILIGNLIVRPDESIILRKGYHQFNVTDFSMGRILYWDDNRNYILDINKNYEYQLEDVNVAYGVAGRRFGVIAGEGVMQTIEAGYVSKKRNYYIDLTPIQAK